MLLVCRHVHHLYDGCVLLTALPRPAHLFIALDWVPLRPARQAIERACRLVGWPVVLRASHPRWSSLPSGKQEEVRRSVRRSIRAGVRLLASGEALAVFPEGYPNVDPLYTPKQSLEDFAPFLPGFASLVELAQSRCSEPVPVIPVGFAYQPGERWEITMRCGPALCRHAYQSREAFVASVQSQVMQLSQPTSFR